MCGILTGACWRLVWCAWKGIAVWSCSCCWWWWHRAGVKSFNRHLKKNPPTERPESLTVLWVIGLFTLTSAVKEHKGKVSTSPPPIPQPQALSALNIFLIWTRTFLVRTWSKSTVCRSLRTDFDVKLSNWTAWAWCGTEHLGLSDTWFIQPWGLRGGRFQPQPSETWLPQLWRVSQDSVRCDKTKHTAKTPRPFPK